ncbi:hypothetical protein F5Y19DRAFT_126260 [Xylariaceae sp. FL1651]|nr:hypothetical protein F5Y19DRAFT_126260 [Xylariaceae sp. FL1651]
MEAMDVDEGGPSQRLALIRAVRTLDEDTSLALPDKIHKLWLLLTAAKNTRLHGVEESILRWLLKQMSGNTESAEHVRRYPLTWTILGYVFPKIPAQALGRSLAYLRFVSILSKTLGDITKAQMQTNGVQADENITVVKKRKRGADLPATLADLRTPEGCLRTASEIFEVLGTLLEEGTSLSGEVAPEKRVGAEHIKSLFSSSSDETRDITASLLLLCYRSLGVSEHDLAKGQQSWINTLSTIWNLRLHSKEDSLEFAKHIYAPASSILANLNGDPTARPTSMNSICCEIWIQQIGRFLSTYFIRPARQRFALDKSVDILKVAVNIAKRDPIASTTVMWDIASRTPRDSTDPKSKLEHTAWAEMIFGIVLEALQPIPSTTRNEVLSQVLDTALQTKSIPSTEILRALYHTHALAPEETDWILVSKIVACDADVFLLDQSPETIFHRMSRVTVTDDKTRDKVIIDVILPLQDAFANARDLTGFVRRWYESLCAVESADESIWFDPRIREHLATILQSSLSGMQLLRLLEGLESKQSKAGELLIVLDGICAGLTDEKLIANVDPKIFSMAFQDQQYDNATPGVLALRWRIAGYLASWEISDDCNRLWKEIKSSLKPILKKGSLTDGETFEAFSCCYNLCLSNHIGGKYEGELMKLTCTVLERLILAINTEADILLFRPFLDLVFNHLPRLSEQPKQEVNTLSDLLVKLFWHISKKSSSEGRTELLELVRPLVQNSDVADKEPLLDALIAQPLDALDNSDTQCGWTEPQSLNILSTLLEFPLEAWTRGRRKRVMSSWKRRNSMISSHAAENPTYALTILRLLVYIMQQPTFYEDMEFADLVDVCLKMKTNDAILLSLIERFIDLTIRQVTTNVNESTHPYLLDASNYAKRLKPEEHSASTHIILLKSLVAALHHHKASSNFLEHKDIDLLVFSQKLSKMVEWSLSKFASEEHELSDPILGDTKLHMLSLTLDAARVISDTESAAKVELSSESYDRLETASNALVSKDAAVGWKLRAFLIKQSADRHTAKYLCEVLDQGSRVVEETSIYCLVDAFVQGKGQSLRDQLLNELMSRDKLLSGSIGSLLAVKRLLGLHQSPNVAALPSNTQGALDFAIIHNHFTSLLSQAVSLTHFKQISEIMLFLLDKHANTMAQYNIEITLTSVVEVCSQCGPKVQGSKAAGEIFANLFKLVALIIKRHRLRLSGHFHILLAALRALMNVLLADPNSHKLASSSRRLVQTQYPPWLHTRLQPRHAERFARLLTLICEPSAASVARSRSRSELDSATDAAKRAAGQYMYLILEVYIKLQLEVDVSREMRKALEVGVFSVIDITSEGCRRVLNESLDAAGRAVFRALFAEYRKFGKWKGV